jgi:transcriptional antiterminator NusG
MVYDQNLWYIIRNTSGVLGFLGSSGKGAKPNPISDSEFNKTAAGTIGYENLTKDGEVEGQESKKVEEEQSSQVYDTDLQVGQTVRVINGMWKGESGVIKLLDSAKGLAKVEIHLFGRVQTVDAKYDDLILDV